MEEMTYAALYQGIWADRSLMAELARRQQNTLLEFMDEVEEFINLHEANGHNNKGCIAIRLLIEKFIRNGKLVRFLAEHRGQQGQNWDRQPRDYQPRKDRHQDRTPRNDMNRENEPREHDRIREEPRRERSRSRSQGTKNLETSMA